MKIISYALLLLISISGFAQSHSSAVREKVELGAFTKIRVDANINVVLYEDSIHNTATVEAREQKLADEITLRVRNGELVISASQNRNYKKKAIVSIPVKGLNRIDLNADAMVLSTNVLNSSRIDVSVNSECWMNIKLTGNINILPGDGWGLAKTSQPSKEIVIGYSE